MAEDNEKKKASDSLDDTADSTGRAVESAGDIAKKLSSRGAVPQKPEPSDNNRTPSESPTTTQPSEAPGHTPSEQTPTTDTSSPEGLTEGHGVSDDRKKGNAEKQEADTNNPNNPQNAPTGVPDVGSHKNDSTGSSDTAPASTGGSGAKATGASSGGAKGSQGASSGTSGGASSGGASSGAGASGAEASGGVAGSAGSAGSSAGSSAAGSAAGGAASGTTAGATAGSVAGPAGTVVGAAAGAVAVPVAKLLFKALAVLLAFLSIFRMMPSLLFDRPNALSDRNDMEKTYNSFYESIEREYVKDYDRSIEATEFEAALFAAALAKDLTTVFYGNIMLTEDEIEEIQDALSACDKFEYLHEVETLQTREEYMERLPSTINMIISMTDMKKHNWFVSIVKWALNTVTNGWYGDFARDVGQRWDGFWNDYVHHYLYSLVASAEQVDVYKKDSEGNDTDTLDFTLARITITYTYDVADKGIGHFADKLNLDDQSMEDAMEMAEYLGDLFGNNTEEYVPWYVQGGYCGDVRYGGSLAQLIMQGITDLGEDGKNLHFDPASPQCFPVKGYKDHPIRSKYGPRPFKADPFHTGVDFAVPGGTPILAMQDGYVVLRRSTSGGFGNHIVVYHGDGVSTMYAHMVAFATPQTGDFVQKGDVIGYIGTTGLSTGNHLHFQYYENYISYANPVGNLNVMNYAAPPDLKVPVEED